MIFRKKTGMVDVRELQKRGVVRIPRKDIVVPRNSDGFVNLNLDSNDSSSAGEGDSSENNSSGANDFLGFMGSADSSAGSDSFSSSVNGYDKREVDSKISDLDNKIYKLEQRIELLERKLDVNQPSNNDVGVMGW